MRNNATRSDYRIISNSNPGQDGCIGSDENMVSNMHLPDFCIAKCLLCTGVVRHDSHADAHGHIITDGNQETVRWVKKAALLAIKVFADPHPPLDQRLCRNFTVQQHDRFS